MVLPFKDKNAFKLVVYETGNPVIPYKTPPENTYFILKY